MPRWPPLAGLHVCRCERTCYGSRSGSFPPLQLVLVFTRTLPGVRLLGRSRPRWTTRPTTRDGIGAFSRRVMASPILAPHFSGARRLWVSAGPCPVELKEDFPAFPRRR